MCLQIWSVNEQGSICPTCPHMAVSASHSCSICALRHFQPQALPVSKMAHDLLQILSQARPGSALSRSAARTDLLNRMLTYDPAKRITARDALRHRYFREVPLPLPLIEMPHFPSAHDTKVTSRRHNQRCVLASLSPLDERYIFGFRGFDCNSSRPVIEWLLSQQCCECALVCARAQCKRG